MLTPARQTCCLYRTATVQMGKQRRSGAEQRAARTTSLAHFADDVRVVWCSDVLASHFVSALLSGHELRSGPPTAFVAEERRIDNEDMDSTVKHSRERTESRPPAARLTRIRTHKVRFIPKPEHLARLTLHSPRPAGAVQDLRGRTSPHIRRGTGAVQTSAA